MPDYVYNQICIQRKSSKKELFLSMMKWETVTLNIHELFSLAEVMW